MQARSGLLASMVSGLRAREAAKKADTEEALRKIVAVTDAMRGFWRRCQGWAPAEAAALLASARLDRQLSLTHTLPDYFESFPAPAIEARVILGYATLRSLCESVLMLFFGVWLRDYNKQPLVDWKQNPIAVQKLSFDRLIAHYSKNGEPTHDAFLRRVQFRGNAIHHFVDRDIGTQEELIADILAYRDFLLSVNGRLPYPDDHFDPGRA